MELGKRIAALRRQQGLTQEQLAQQLGTTRQAVSKWESDKSEPDIATLIQLGNLFGVSMDHLLLGAEDTSQAVPKKNSRKHFLLPCLLVLLLGIAILLLLPLFASMYRSIVPGPQYTNANNYLSEWPMMGVVLLGLLLTGTGIGGLAWVFQETTKRIIQDYLTP